MDVAEKRPVTGKKSADKTTSAIAKGAAGHALGVVFVKDAEKQATADAKQKESMKDRLRKLVGLDRESHLEFRRVLEDRLQVIRDTAKGLGIGIAEYIGGDSESASVYSSLSMWAKMSRACETGWKPNYENPWGAISMAATDSLHAKAAERATEIGVPQSAAPTTRRGRKAKSNLDKAIAYLTPMPLHDLEVIYEWLGKHIANVGNPKITGARVAATRAASAVAKKGTTVKAIKAATKVADMEAKVATNEELGKAVAKK